MKTSNMYDFVTKKGKTVNPLLGKCKHNCKYCYVPDICKNKTVLLDRYSGPLRLDEKLLSKKINGKGGTVFVSNMNDLFASNVSADMIKRVLNWLSKEPENTYLLQTKNPTWLSFFKDLLPPKVLLVTTIESSYNYGDTKMVPSMVDRAKAMSKLSDYKTMVTVEPIMDFSPNILKTLLIMAKPDLIAIGADSKLLCLDCNYGSQENHNFRWRGHNYCGKCGSTNITNAHGLVEPSESSIIELIDSMKSKCQVIIKDNLHRLYAGGQDR